MEECMKTQNEGTCVGAHEGTEWRHADGQLMKVPAHTLQVAPGCILLLQELSMTPSSRQSLACGEAGGPG